MRLGMGELIVILLIAVLLFGGKKLSGVGKALGQSIREFKDEVKGDEKKEEEATEKKDA
ncbi:MAG: twin-arginine translocase TatA/TatE family subunit [Clostridia bacterium]|nr:twin-arginine translocase TatA/TatE family subunit [Clostridia bacterium]